MRPRATFLSSAISSSSRSGLSAGPLIGRPARPSSERTRCTSAAAIRPARADNSVAITIPAAIASPCSHAPYPVPASMAWPKVWPKLSRLRTPDSRSSAATTPALSSQQRRTAWTRALRSRASYAALVNRGGKPGEIADHPAPERDDERIAAAARREQRVEGALEARPALRLLAVVEHDLSDARARRLERLSHAREIKRCHDLVGHHGRAAGGKMRRVQRRRIEDAGADVNRIGALAERYAEAFHCSSSFSSSSRASACTLWDPVSSTRSATPRYRASRSA